MAAEPTCPHCGKMVPPTALQGICPECMLRAGLISQTDFGRTGSLGTGSVSLPPPAPEEIAPLFPHLEILECLGRGGMGVVYKARQPRLNRLVALKILAREKERDPKFNERFTREAQALARLNHPNIVTIHDFGGKDGLCYLVMEFVDGLSLRQMLRAGTIKPEEALAIVPRICEALQYAHELGIVHRDIKPENILVDKSGRVKIADFGIAKMVGAGAVETLERPVNPQTGMSAPPPETLTEAGKSIGTPQYMAPEQMAEPQQVDHRADIYSLGVVFYEMLTGELPSGPFQPPSRKVPVDGRLDQVVSRALEKEPARRYQQASVFQTDVETIAAGATAPVFAARTGGPIWRWVAMLVFLSAAITMLVFWSMNSSPTGRAFPESAGMKAESAPVQPAPPDPIPGWFSAGSHPSDYAMTRDRAVTHSGKASAYVKSIVPQPRGFGTLLQSFKADNYRGRRVRLSGFLRSRDVVNWAGLWVRVDSADNRVLAFDNMHDRAVRGTTGWTHGEVVLDVPEESAAIFLGLLLTGPGQIWMDDLKIEVVGTDVSTTGGKPGDTLPATLQLDFMEQPRSE